MNEQLTLEGKSVQTCTGCGSARPEHKTAEWTSLDNDRCRACRVAAGEELVECDGCQAPTFEDELYQDSYYLSPFDDEPTLDEARVCQDCWDASDFNTEGLFWCDGCNRQITDCRGHHMHYRITDMGQWCLACVEETLKAEGVAGFDDRLEALFVGESVFGMFFNVGELEAAGWTPERPYVDWKVGGLTATCELGAAAKALHERGRRIIIGYERLSIVGDEGYVTLFSKAAARCDRCDDQPGPEGQPCRRCGGQGTYRSIDHARIAAIAASRRTDKGQRGLLPYSVGLANVSGSMLGRFETEQEAAEFIATLEGYEDGRYYLDGPPDDDVGDEGGQ